MPSNKVAKVIYHAPTDVDENGTTWIDVTQKTVTAGSMLSGITSLKNDGTDITGNIASKTSSDLTVSGATVTVPAGYYSSNANKSVASGTAGTPIATKGTVSNHQVSITPSVTNTTGYITGSTKTGTAVTVTVSELESGTKSITENGTGISVSGYSAVDVAVSTGPDCPVFTVVQNAQTGTVTVTCNKTFSECYTSITDSPSDSVAMLDYKVGDTLVASTGLLLANISSNNQIKYIVNSGQEVPNYEINYFSNGTISYSDASGIFQDLTVTAGGTYPPSGSLGHIAYKTVTVASGSATTPATTITANPTVSVSSSGLITATVSGSQNITPTISAGYVSSGTSGTISVSGSNTQQLTTQAAKTVSPTESEQTAVTSGVYTTGVVKVGAISSTYVGSGITSRSSSDLTVSGATVTAPAGYYASSASKSVSSMTLPTYSTSNATSGYTSKATIGRSTNDQYINIPTGYNSAGAYYKISAVANGSATTPATIINAQAIISINSSGLITASVSGSEDITPTVSAGYISSGTAGTVSVSGSGISQLSTQAAQTIYPSTSDQTISSYKYLTGTQTIKGVVVTGLTAANIVSGVTVKIGDSADDDRITSVTGTYDDSIEVVRLI